MQALPKSDDPNLLVGAEHFSDAGVYRINEHTAIVQTVDFFPPVVEDPYTYGRIAAANSLSDVYAMGGTPKTALNIVGFPDNELEMEILQAILQGGAERVSAAGAVIVGGHSVRDAEVKYGLSVTGLVDPERMFTNDAARPGDALVLTKPLGTGFVTTAHRQDKCPDDVLEAACAGMVQLNAAAAEAGIATGVRAATDVTGFGLAGHGLEVALASRVTLHFELGKIPWLPGARDLSDQGIHTRANRTNRDFTADRTRFEHGADDGAAEILFDPQTSGGLLVAVAPDKADALVQRCRDNGAEHTAIIGYVEGKDDVHLVIHP